MRTVVESPWLRYNRRQGSCVGGHLDVYYPWEVCRDGLLDHGFDVGDHRFKLMLSSVEVPGAVKSRWSPITDAMEEAGEKIGLRCSKMVEPTEGQKQAGITGPQRAHVPVSQRSFVWWWVEIDG
jgi:hypothetical protein